MELIGDLERAFAGAIYPNRILIAVVGVGVLAALAMVAWRRRWDRSVRRHTRASAMGVLVGLAVVVPLGWYLGSPLFISTTVDEPAPVAVTDPSPGPTPPASTDRPTQWPAPSPTPVPLIERSGTFKGADDFHFGEGTARLIERSPGSLIVRLEDFAVRNGPDLYVYLSPAADGYANGAIELGRLKADRGNQNYEVPAGTEVSTATSVVIWCMQFSVLFATATLE